MDGKVLLEVLVPYSAICIFTEVPKWRPMGMREGGPLYHDAT